MKPMCENILIYLDGELSDSEKLAFEKHLTHCKQCQAVINRWGKAYQELDNMNESLPEVRKLEWLEEIEHQSNSKRWEWGLIAATILLFILNMTYFYFFMEKKGESIPDALIQYTQETTENVYEDPMSDFLLTYVIDGENNE